MQAQTRAVPDSVLMVRDTGSGTVGYVLPHHAAAYFRDMFYYAQAMEAQLDTLAHLVSVQQEQAAHQQDRLRLLQEMNRDLKTQLALYERDVRALEETLQTTNLARRRERRRRTFWRTATFVLAGSTAALGVLAAR